MVKYNHYQIPIIPAYGRIFLYKSFDVPCHNYNLNSGP